MSGQTQIRKPYRTGRPRAKFYIIPHPKTVWTHRPPGVTWDEAISDALDGLAVTEDETQTAYLIGMGRGADRHA